MFSPLSSSPNPEQFLGHRELHKVSQAYFPEFMDLDVLLLKVQSEVWSP